MGHKKSNFLKLGVYPPLQPPGGIQSSIFLFGPIFGPNLGSEDQKAVIFFKIVDFLLLFFSIVKRSFKINENIGFLFL